MTPLVTVRGTAGSARRGSAAEPTQSPEPGHLPPVPSLQLLALLALPTTFWCVCLFFLCPRLLWRNSPTHLGPVPDNLEPLLQPLPLGPSVTSTSSKLLALGPLIWPLISPQPRSGGSNMELFVFLALFPGLGGLKERGFGSVLKALGSIRSRLRYEPWLLAVGTL